MDAPQAPFGSQLRRWRLQRGLSQMALALDAGVSTRHLSWLETAKAGPSRAMVLKLAERLDLPLRERNALLVAAGFAPLYRETALTAPALSAARAMLERLLQAYEPAPALAVDRHWNLVAHNRVVPLLLQGVAPALLAPPANVLRMSLHPQGLAPLIVNLAGWREHVLARLSRQAANTGDPVLAALLVELRALPAGSDAGEAVMDDWAVPLALNTPLGRLNFITTITVFGAPHDVTLAEIAVETLLPADAATAAALRDVMAAVPT